MQLNEVIDNRMHQYEQPQIDKEDNGRVDIESKDIIEHNEEARHQEDGEHDVAHSHATADELVVDVVLVGQEGIVMVAQPADKDSDNIQQGDEQRGYGYDM